MAKPVVLHIEDETSLAELVRRYLAQDRATGWEVLNAPTLAQGLAILESQAVSLMLLDLNLTR